MKVPIVLTSGVLLAVLGGAAFAQTQIDLRTQSKSIDFSAASSTKPAKAGTVHPSNCSAGELFYRTDAPAGANLYGCTAQNVWTILGGGSGGGGAPNYSTSFDAQTVVSIAGSAHNFGTASLIVDCYDNATPANRIEPDRVSVHPTTDDVTVTFVTAQSGKCVINGSGGGLTSVFGRTGIVTATAGDYAATQITNTPAGDIAATTVQGAVNELDTEKAAAAHVHTAVGDVTGDLASTTVAKLRGRNVASTAPTNGQVLAWSSGNNRWEPAAGSGGGGATNASQLYDFQVVKTAASVLTINGQCSSGLPCVARFGNTSHSFAASAVLTISAGSGIVYWYLASDGTITAGHNGLTVTSCIGCAALNGVTSFPANAIPLWTWSATSGAWDASGIDYRGWLSLKNVVAGSGIAASEASGTTTVSVDTAVVGLRVAVPPTSTTACTSGSWAADASYFYICAATDTWGRAAVSSW